VEDTGWHWAAEAAVADLAQRVARSDEAGASPALEASSAAAVSSPVPVQLRRLLGWVYRALKL
jgi:hypothetical protein